jgi:hypothetical protein
MVWSLLRGTGMGLFMGTWEWRRARSGFPPHTNFKEEVWKSIEIKYKPPPWMENQTCCKEKKNLKPKIDRLNIIIMFSWIYISLRIHEKRC